MSLPPLPPLDRAQLQPYAVTTAVGRLEALRPAAPPYICDNPAAPHLLLIPGLGLDGTGLVRQLALGAHCHLHLFQMPNTSCAGESHLGEFARFAEEYIAAQKLDAASGGLFIGGNSMGGAVALQLALRRRVKVRGLVLLGTYGSCRRIPFYQRWSAPLAWVLPMGFFRSVLWIIAGKSKHSTLTREEGRWMANPILKRDRNYFGRAVRCLTTLNLLEETKALQIPALILHGDRDAVLKHACAEELAQTLPGSTLITIPGAGHNLFFTHAQEVNAAIAEFMSKSK